MKMIEEPTFETPIRISSAGGLPINLLRTVGQTIDYVDGLLEKEVGHTELLEAAKRDLHVANDSQKVADIDKARTTTVKAFAALKVLVKNSVTGQG